jgi:hypothetical protein
MFETLRDGDTYEGEFKNGKFHGIGEYYFASTGNKVRARFEDGKLIEILASLNRSPNNNNLNNNTNKPGPN